MVKNCDKTIIENVYKKIIVFTAGTIYNRFISLHIYWVFYVWRGGDSIDIDVHKPWKQSILKEINNAEDGYWRLYEYAAPPRPQLSSWLRHCVYDGIWVSLSKVWSEKQ